MALPRAHLLRYPNHPPQRCKPRIGIIPRVLQALNLELFAAPSVSGVITSVSGKLRLKGFLRRSGSGSSGVSLVELIVTLAILSILAALIVPSAQLTSKRLKEIELKRSLRTIRTALDDYKKAYDKAVDEKKITQGLQTNASSSGYPKNLKLLVEGDDFGGAEKTQAKKKFLRRIPVDPFNRPKPGEEPKWGIRAYKDEPDSKTSGEDAEDVFDVYSLSEETAIDGTKYKDW